MKRYSKYKDSGIEWIGEIPKGWESIKLKYLFAVVNGATPSSSEETYWDGNIMWITPADYKTEDIYIKTSKRTITENGLNSCGTSIVPVESIIVSNRAPIGAIAITKNELCTNQGCKALVKKTIINEKYTYYYLSIMSEALNMLGRGTTFLELSSADLSNFIQPLPNDEIQIKIVDFLDKKTTAIDTFIYDKQKLIDLLKEKRQAIISETVTKGLDKNSKMKDSGIEWIGEIPEGWEVIALKRLSELITDGTHQTPEYIDEGIPFLSIKDVSLGYLDFSDTKYISHETHVELSKHAPVEIGDVLFTRIGTLGISIVVDRGVPFDIFVSLGLIKLDKKRINSKWLVYNMISPHYFNYIQLVKAGGGTAAAKFNLESVANSYITMPTFSEQKLIADYLDTQTANYDTLISDIQSQIEKLKEYRQSVISEAVTGKIMIESKTEAVEGKTATANLHFKRRVLAAHILNELCDEPTMGHVKLEKLLFLSEYCAESDLGSKYVRHAAGPYDSNGLRSIDAQLKKAKWFDCYKDGFGYKYRKLEKSNDYLTYYDRYFDDQQKENITSIINIFKSATTEQCEIVATLYGAWNDFLINNNTTPTDDQIVAEVLNNWHENKVKIRSDRWMAALVWMRANNIIPVGYGKSTKGGNA